MSAVLDVFKDKLVKRSLSLKLIDATAALSGKLAKITVTITNGISQENAKKISKLIRDRAPDRQGPDPGRGVAGLQQEP